jgi:hypothetical protein
MPSADTASFRCTQIHHTADAFSAQAITSRAAYLDLGITDPE